MKKADIWYLEEAFTKKNFILGWSKTCPRIPAFFFHWPAKNKAGFWPRVDSICKKSQLLNEFIIFPCSQILSMNSQSFYEFAIFPWFQNLSMNSLHCYDFKAFPWYKISICRLHALKIIYSFVLLSVSRLHRSKNVHKSRNFPICIHSWGSLSRVL